MKPALSLKLTTAAAGYLRRAVVVGWVLLAVLCVGSAAGAAGSGWHITRVDRLGKRIGGAEAAAVNRFGTSVVVFASRHSLTVGRRPAGASKFKVSRRFPATAPSDCPGCQVYALTALANGRFLLVYRNGLRLLARSIDAQGHLRRAAHFLAAVYQADSIYALPLVAVDSDASRAVVVWGVNNNSGTTVRVEAAIHDQAGWSNSKILYSYKESAPPAGAFQLRLVGDSQDRFLISLHGSNGDTTAAMWGLPAGSRQWETATPPQEGSQLDPTLGAKLASVNGTITAAWQDLSGALVISTWDGSSWSTPVTAIKASYSNGHPNAIFPFFVSDGSRAALVWPNLSLPKGLDGPIDATIRAGSGASWSAPLVLPHSRQDFPWVGSASEDTLDTFWFTPSGALAGVWEGDPIKTSGGGHRALYLGTVSANTASATVLSRTQTDNDYPWFVLPRAAGLHTIVWGDKGRRFFATATGNGTLLAKRPLPACGRPGTWASNAEARPKIVAVGPSSPAGIGAKCPSLLLW